MKTIHYIKEVDTIAIDETKIGKCFAKDDCILNLLLAGYMATYHKVNIKENQEFFYVVKDKKIKNERYSWLRDDDNAFVVFVSVDGEIWHFLSDKEFEKNFYSLAEMRDKKINSILYE